MNYYRIGKILNTHGLKGDLKIMVVSDFERFNVKDKVYLYYKDEYIPLVVKKRTDYPPHILVRFEGLEDINLVEKYKGYELFISEDEQQPLDDGEYYFHELIGLDAYNDRADYKGKVLDVREVPQGYLLVIKMENGKKALVPFRDEFIGKVTKERVIIKEIEGLF